MRINGITNKILTNKTFLKGLEKISDHGTSFGAAASLAMALGVRTFSIYNTPDVEKENKLYLMANSICSGLVKFGLVEAVALPIENAVNRIDKNSAKYLQASTLKNFNPNSPGYKFITQIIKLSTGVLTAIPKSVITVALIPIVMAKVFKFNPFDEIKKAAEKYPYKNIPNPFLKEKPPEPKKESELSVPFTGRLGDKLSKSIGKIINNKKVQNFAKKYEMEDEDIYKHVTALTDVMLTSAAVAQTNKSDSIKENCKKVLNYNNIISTAISIGAMYTFDDLIKKHTTESLEKFKELNKNNPKLPKYIQGMNILRPTIICAVVYYGILPMFSTFMSDKIEKFVNRNKKAG